MEEGEAFLYGIRPENERVGGLCRGDGESAIRHVCRRRRDEGGVPRRLHSPEILFNEDALPFGAAAYAAGAAGWLERRKAAGKA